MNESTTSLLTSILGGTVGLTVTLFWYLSRPKALPSHKKENKQVQRRLIVDEPNSDLTKVKFDVKEFPMPRPRYGQVLVKIAALPVNPSDFNEWKSPNFKGRPFGLEGSGLVVASGGGIMAGLLVGRKVGIIASGRDSKDVSNSMKTAAEYICIDAMKSVWSLPDNVNLVDAASWFVNPGTVLSILGTAQSDAMIHTGASSQLGQMLVKLVATKPNVTLVNVVRRKEHVTMLKDLGAKHVICQADEDWLDQLSAKAKELNVKVAFDAVAGDMTGQLLSILPKRGIVYVYGVLAGQPVGKVEPIDLIYRQKQVKGFSLAHSWLPKAGATFGPLGVLWRTKWCIQQLAPNLSEEGWASSQYHDCSMADMQQEFSGLAQKGFTGKKLRIRMDL
eukprot:CAMPEP_0172458202 /NCGR_PEP_ID=MMETSP1065-20121228/26352_1 /TAXON_ID=265537 /ORGANISM="Amphiprora paludosa, Strain CCMP125" /LENGTH=389 /DNA_ID=CAMNT_0013212341 /DNA_START=163 /DNA_END=1332 /DNA_ORIENTATION=-